MCGLEDVQMEMHSPFFLNWFASSKVVTFLCPSKSTDQRINVLLKQRYFKIPISYIYRAPIGEVGSARKMPVAILVECM